MLETTLSQGQSRSEEGIIYDDQEWAVHWAGEYLQQQRLDASLIKLLVDIFADSTRSVFFRAKAYSALALAAGIDESSLNYRTLVMQCKEGNLDMSILRWAKSMIAYSEV